MLRTTALESIYFLLDAYCNKYSDGDELLHQRLEEIIQTVFPSLAPGSKQKQVLEPLDMHVDLIVVIAKYDS